MKHAKRLLYETPKPIKSRYISDLLNRAEMNGGKVYFVDEYNQAWKLSMIKEKPEATS